MRPDRRILARGLLRRGCFGGCWRVDRSVGSDSGRRGRLVPARWRGLALASEQRPLQVRQLGLQLSLPPLRSPQVGLGSVECALELLTASARGPPPDWLSFLAGFRPAHNDRADRPILGWQGGQSKVLSRSFLACPLTPTGCSSGCLGTPCLSVEVAAEIRCACLCATPVVLWQSLTVAPRNLNAYSGSSSACADTMRAYLCQYDSLNC